MNKINDELCRMYLVRHGETVWNTERRMQGHQDSPLTAKGIRQAEQLAQMLADVHFEAVYSSDSGRAIKTAEIISDCPDVEIQATQELRETGLGPFEGRQVTEVLEQLKNKITHRDSLDHDGQMSFKIHPEVESFGATAQRIVPLLKKIAKNNLGKNVLAVSHAGSIRATLASIGYAKSNEFPHGAIGNTSYAVIASDGKHFSVEKTVGINLGDK